MTSLLNGLYFVTFYRFDSGYCFNHRARCRVKWPSLCYVCHQVLQLLLYCIFNTDLYKKIENKILKMACMFVTEESDSFKSCACFTWIVREEHGDS